MNDLSLTDRGFLIEQLRKLVPEGDLPALFERDIFLFDTHIAGTSHIDGIEQIEPQLEIGGSLEFLREPDNPFDPQAILIRTHGGVKLGYVPQRDNAVFARLMDAGKLLFGRISDKQLRGPWVYIAIKVYLHE